MLILIVPGKCQSNQYAHTSGQYIVDPSGNRLLLRGINLGNWLVPEGYMLRLDRGAASPREIERLVDELVGPEEAEAFWMKYRNRYVTRADIKFIRIAGFNSIRIPLHYKFFLSDDAPGFHYLDRVVSWARENGIWVILDLHCAPGGQTGTNIDDSLGYPWLFGSVRNQDLAVAVWARIAAHYQKEPTVLGYDLLNEPIPPFAQIALYKDKIVPLYQRIIRGIRQVDAHHILILEGADWAGNFDIFSPPVADDVVYSFHRYWMPSALATIQPYIAFRNRYNVPIWLGESGENDSEWIRTFVRMLEDNQIGWCLWPYKKMRANPAAATKVGANSAVATFWIPSYWDEIAKFSEFHGTSADGEHRLAARPPKDHINKALEGLLQNVDFDHCEINKEYLEALGFGDSIAEHRHQGKTDGSSAP
jgi:aryl-phospho-beta-D-glucosidase BglC (GH1 family)